MACRHSNGERWELVFAFERSGARAVLELVREAVWLLVWTVGVGLLAVVALDDALLAVVGAGRKRCRRRRVMALRYWLVFGCCWLRGGVMLFAVVALLALGDELLAVVGAGRKRYFCCGLLAVVALLALD